MFQSTVLELAGEENRRYFSRLFNIAPDDLQQRLSEKKIKMDEMKKVVEWAILMISRLRDLTRAYPRNLVRSLREAHLLSRRRLCGIYARMFPGVYLSLEDYSKLETGELPFTKNHAGQLATLFCVHESLFYPSTFVDD